ncbi:hypothetical protein DMN91_009975 [Ooceraea biroi]|uniref:Reverse transcriptase RNase H-like domain-containing protein n=1 Tax=Ooceraea biroi TaxID=2015173 RepID=A0A3L8DCU0_OOCBI|nr:hypothetical protein DMN91_009975 [Ooceraea biroi]
MQRPEESAQEYMAALQKLSLHCKFGGCGQAHFANSCTLPRSVKCRECGGLGHLQKVCKEKDQAHMLEEVCSVMEQEHLEHRAKFTVPLRVENQEVIFDVDCGSAVTLLPLVLAVDASPYGVGAVLSHWYPDGTERVIQYASNSLTETQKKYAQIDKEALAIIFGVKKFHQFLYGNRFTLLTDHKPLAQIFNPQKGLPAYSAMRMQHYAIFLQAFNFDIKYHRSQEHGNADGFSRLPIQEKSVGNYDTIDVFQIENLEVLPVTAKSIREDTNKDRVLIKIRQALEKDDGRIWKRHIDQMKAIGNRISDKLRSKDIDHNGPRETSEIVITENNANSNINATQGIFDSGSRHRSEDNEIVESEEEGTAEANVPHSSTVEPNTSSHERQSTAIAESRPQRNRKPPSRYGNYLSSF